jgi:hypothetical protein
MVHAAGRASFVMTFICSFLGRQCTLPADAVEQSTAEETRNHVDALLEPLSDALAFRARDERSARAPSFRL